MPNLTDFMPRAGSQQPDGSVRTFIDDMDILNLVRLLMGASGQGGRSPFQAQRAGERLDLRGALATAQAPDLLRGLTPLQAPEFSDPSTGMMEGIKSVLGLAMLRDMMKRQPQSFGRSPAVEPAYQAYRAGERASY